MMNIRFWSCGVALALAALLTGCPPPPARLLEAISITPNLYDFQTSTIPFTMQVWNNNPSFSSLNISVRASQPWITVDPVQLTSAAPQGNQLDQKLVTISVNRSQLPRGQSEGTVTFSAAQVIPKVFVVRVTQNQDPVESGLSVDNPVMTYSVPWLVDMHFGLKDSSTGRAVVADPATQVTLKAYEGDENHEVNATSNGLQIKRAAARQFKANLILDYSVNMQVAEGAILAMESAAKNTFLPALNVDAQVGIWEFHADDLLPFQVTPFTVDKTFLRQQIDRIQSQIVQNPSSASGSRLWDALQLAALDFGEGNSIKESRYIILFTNGRDTSSRNANVNTVIQAAAARGIGVYVVALGPNVAVTELQGLTASTGGLFFPTQNVSQVAGVFGEIIHDLDGQYNVRWASLQRTGAGFFPSFRLAVNGKSVVYTGNQRFVPSNYQGAEERDVRKGVLRIEVSNNAARTTAFLRASYVPRSVTQLHLLVNSTFPYTVEQVDVNSDGLVDAASWTMQVEPDAETGGKRIHLTSKNGQPLQFADFGPLLKFEFNTVSDDPAELFSSFEVDNSVYPANLQYFVVEGFTD